MDYAQAIKNTSLKLIYDKDIIRTALNALDNVTVMYGGTCFAVHFGNKIPVMTIFKDGVTYADAAFFDVQVSAIHTDGVFYCPAAEAYAAAGLEVITDGRLVIAGEKGTTDIFKRIGGVGVNEYAEIAAYIAKHNTDEPHCDDCDALLERWVKYMIGDENTNDMSDPYVQVIIQKIAVDAMYAKNTMQKDGNTKTLFKGDFMQNNADRTVDGYYERILSMAKAYTAYGSPYFGDKELLDNVLYGLKWMSDNMYGRNQITDDNWGFISQKGWYLWAIAAPKALISTMMLVRRHITYEQKCEYLSFFDALRDKPYGVGYNRMDYAMLMIGSAALKNDVKKLVEIQLEIESPFLFADNNRKVSIETFLDAERAKYTVTKGQGFYTDGSYVYHTLQALNATYGVSHLEKTVEYLSLVHGTPFDVTTPQADNVLLWIKNSFEGLMYQCAMYKCLHGRSKYPDCYDTGRRIVTAYLESLDIFDGEEAKFIKRLIKYHIQSAPFVDFYSQLKISYISRLKEIMSDDSIKPACEFRLSKNYHHMDKFVHKRDNWSICISMSSARMFNYESICNEGQRFWYTSDGMTEYYVKGRYQNGSLDYWNYVNYYRLPGTTIDTQERKAVSIHQGNEYLSSCHFVGGVTLSDTYGVAVMDLESYHNDEDFGVDAGVLYGRKAPKHKCDLTAKKAWFMFDDEVVCIGNDINASDNNNAEVITVVDNYMLDSNEFAFDENEGWACLDNACGYYFPNKIMPLTKVCENEYSGWKAGEKCWSREDKPKFLEIWFSHGINPKSSSYEYVLLPGMSKEKLRDYVKNPAVTVLKNNAEIQVVRNELCGVTGIVFWKEGCFDFIKVDCQMLVMYSIKSGLKLSFSDPTHKLTNGKIILDGIFSVVRADDAVSVCVNDGKTEILADFTDCFGRTIELELI